MQRTCLLLLVIILSAVASSGHTSRVTGNTVEPSGGVVVGAEVTLIGPGNTAVASTKTGTDGVFAVDVPAGSYALEVTADGFEKTVEGISANVNGRPIDITLSIAGIKQQVDVEDNPNLISL